MCACLCVCMFGEYIHKECVAQIKEYVIKKRKKKNRPQSRDQEATSAHGGTRKEVLQLLIWGSGSHSRSTPHLIDLHREEGCTSLLRVFSSEYKSTQCVSLGQHLNKSMSHIHSPHKHLGLLRICPLDFSHCSKEHIL